MRPIHIDPPTLVLLNDAVRMHTKLFPEDRVGGMELVDGATVLVMGNATMRAYRRRDERGGMVGVAMAEVEEIRTMADPARWPRPVDTTRLVLSLKRADTPPPGAVGDWWETGILFAVHHLDAPSPWVVRAVDDEGLADEESMLRYDGFAALYDDGWRVD